AALGGCVGHAGTTQPARHVPRASELGATPARPGRHAVRRGARAGEDCGGAARTCARRHAMNVPRATARLQLHAQFDLRAALAQVPYYARLGVSHLYVSPLTRARSGSRHGYDVVDHGMVSPELGGEPALRELSEALHRHGMGLIADIVPNHMAASHENSWWHDVLRNGRGSAHAGFFDIDWQAPGALHGKVLAPFLAKPYGQALVDGDIVLSR